MKMNLQLFATKPGNNTKAGGGSPIINIYSNNGSTLLKTMDSLGELLITEQGLKTIWSSDYWYTYNGDKTFLGFSILHNSSIPDTGYSVGDTIYPSENIDLYIVEQDIQTQTDFTVTFNKQDGSDGTDNVTATLNSEMPSIVPPTKVGYTFNGYYDSASNGTKYYNANGTSARNWDKNSDATLYAKWIEDVKNYTVFSLSQITNLDSGTHTISVVSKAEGTIKSQESNKLTFNI